MIHVLIIVLTIVQGKQVIFQGYHTPNSKILQYFNKINLHIIKIHDIGITAVTAVA